jgi:hypothetical protein
VCVCEFWKRRNKSGRNPFQSNCIIVGPLLLWLHVGVGRPNLNMVSIICPSVHLSVCSFVRLHLSVYSFVRLFICPFIHLSVYSFVRYFICPFIHLSVYSFVRLFICPFIHLSVYSFVGLFIYPFVHLSDCSFVCSFIYPFVHLSVCSFVQEFVCSFVQVSVCSLVRIKLVRDFSLVSMFNIQYLNVNQFRYGDAKQYLNWKQNVLNYQQKKYILFTIFS